MSSYGELANTIIQQKGAGGRWSGLNTSLDIMEAYKQARLKYQMDSQLKTQESEAQQKQGFNTGLSHIYGQAAMTGIPVDPGIIQDYARASSMGAEGLAQGNFQSSSPTMETTPNVSVTNTPGKADGITVTGSEGRNEAALSKFNPTFAARIKAIADYKQPVGSLRQLNQIGGIVSSYDPSFDANQYTERRNFITSTWDKGELSKQRSAIENVTQHAVYFKQYMTALNNGDVQKANQIKNDFANATGSPIPQDAATFARVVGVETAKALSPTGVLTDEQQKEAAKAYPENASPAQAADSVKNAMRIMKPRMNTILERYKERMGKYPSNAFSSETVEAFKSLDPDSYNELSSKLKVNGVQQEAIPTPDNMNQSSQQNHVGKKVGQFTITG